METTSACTRTPGRRLCSRGGDSPSWSCFHAPRREVQWFVQSLMAAVLRADDADLALHRSGPHRRGRCGLARDKQWTRARFQHNRLPPSSAWDVGCANCVPERWKLINYHRGKGGHTGRVCRASARNRDAELLRSREDSRSADTDGERFCWSCLSRLGDK